MTRRKSAVKTPKKAQAKTVKTQQKKVKEKVPEAQEAELNTPEQRSVRKRTLQEAEQTEPSTPRSSRSCATRQAEIELVRSPSIDKEKSKLGKASSKVTRLPGTAKKKGQLQKVSDSKTEVVISTEAEKSGLRAKNAGQKVNIPKCLDFSEDIGNLKSEVVCNKKTGSQQDSSGDQTNQEEDSYKFTKDTEMVYQENEPKIEEEPGEDNKFIQKVIETSEKIVELSSYDEQNTTAKDVEEPFVFNIEEEVHFEGFMDDEMVGTGDKDSVQVAPDFSENKWEEINASCDKEKSVKAELKIKEDDINRVLPLTEENVYETSREDLSQQKESSKIKSDAMEENINKHAHEKSSQSESNLSVLQRTKKRGSGKSDQKKSTAKGKNEDIDLVDILSDDELIFEDQWGYEDLSEDEDETAEVQASTEHRQADNADRVYSPVSEESSSLPDYLPSKSIDISLEDELKISSAPKTEDVSSGSDIEIIESTNSEKKVEVFSLDDTVTDSVRDGLMDKSTASDQERKTNDNLENITDSEDSLDTESRSRHSRGRSPDAHPFSRERKRSWSRTALSRSRSRSIRSSSSSSSSSRYDRYRGSRKSRERHESSSSSSSSGPFESKEEEELHRECKMLRKERQKLEAIKTELAKVDTEFEILSEERKKLQIARENLEKDKKEFLQKRKRITGVEDINKTATNSAKDEKKSIGDLLQAIGETEKQRGMSFEEAIDKSRVLKAGEKKSIGEVLRDSFKEEFNPTKSSRMSQIAPAAATGIPYVSHGGSHHISGGHPSVVTSSLSSLNTAFPPMGQFQPYSMNLPAQTWPNINRFPPINPPVLTHGPVLPSQPPSRPSPLPVRFGSPPRGIPHRGTSWVSIDYNHQRK